MEPLSTMTSPSLITTFDKLPFLLFTALFYAPSIATALSTVLHAFSIFLT
jgi:hypothetical protein